MIRRQTASASRCGHRCAGIVALSLSTVWLLTPGCASTQSQRREESAERWNRARAQVKLKLASDHLAAGHVEDAATELAAAVRLDPVNPELQTLQARVCLAHGDLTGAQQLLERASAEGALRGEIEYLLGIIEEQQLHWTAALEHYVAAADADPQEVAHVVAIVQVMLQLGQSGDALALLESYEPQFGWTGAYYAALAECHEQLDDWKAAATAWRTVADAHDAPDIRERLAVALYRAGEWAEAVPLLEQLLNETAAEPETHLRVFLAECLLEAGQPKLAHAELGLILRDDPRNVPALQLVARAFAQQGQFEQARQTAERALRLADDNPRTLELAAALAFHAGDTERAAVLARRIEQVAPGSDNPIARQILGCASQITPPTQ